MKPTQSALLADLIIDGKKSEESGLYISEMTFNEGISQISKAVLTICSNKLCLKLRGKKDQNGKPTEKGLLDYLDKKATICLLDEEKISRTFTGKITSVTHLGVSNTVSGNLYKYEFIIEPSIIDMRFAHHTRQIKKTIQETLKEILSIYYGSANIDFISEKPDTNTYLFFQQNETDYDFFTRLLSQFGLSYFICSQKNQNSDEYYEQVIISDGKSFELPTATRPANSHADRSLNILVNKSSKTKSENIRISSWQMSNSITVDDICKTDSLKSNANNKRLWFLDSLATPHSETQTDDKTREKVADNYLNSLRSSSANWFGTARINDFQATDILNIFDFYSPCNLDSEEKEKSALVSEDTIRARILSLNLQLSNILPFEADSSNLSPSAEVKFRCAEISKDAPSVFTAIADKNALYSDDSSNKTIISNLDVTASAKNGLSLRKATVCYPPNTTSENMKNLPKKNTPAKINIDSNTGESYFYAKIDNSDTCSEVLFTMPLAGLGQGLYRYPRIGERILVLDNEDSRYILHSYIPDTNTMPFFQYGTVPSDEAIKTLLENEGKLKDLSDDDVKAKIKEYKNKIINQPEEQAAATVLRHNSGNFIAKDSTESNTTTYLADEASDQFTAYLKPITRNVDNSFKASDYKNKDIKYSEIGMYSGFKDGDDWKPEVLRIQTPGNQYNHTGLTNVSTANAFVFSTPNATKFGEFRVIDVGSVVIDAKRSITLKVAGNVIKISETGISIGSQSTCTEGTPYDSKLSLNPIGASLSGLEVKIGSTMSTSVSSGFGELIKLNKGKVSIGGHSVDLATDDNRTMNFDLACYYADLAQYLLLFGIDQGMMRKRLNIGYNDMVKTGNFNFKFKLDSKDAVALDWFEKSYGTIKPIWGVIQKFVRLLYKIKGLPPKPKNFGAFVAETIFDFMFLLYDAIMADLAIDIADTGALKKLTPEQVQRQTTIMNFIKIAAKTVFLSLMVPVIKAQKVGDFSYQKMSSSEIATFSPALNADFVNFKATAHNFNLNPLAANPDPTMAIPAMPTNPAQYTASMVAASMRRLENLGKAGAFAALLEASGATPAFSIQSKEGSVGFDSYALKHLQTSILTAETLLEVDAAKRAIAKFKTPKTEFNATGPLNISSGIGDAKSSIETTPASIKITSGPNGGNSSIEISPANIKATSTLLDAQATTLQMKSQAALKIDGGATKFESNIFNIDGEIANIKTQLTKVG